MGTTGQIIAFGIGSFLFGGVVITLIAGLVTLELRRELERLQDRVDIERRATNSWYSGYTSLLAETNTLRAFKAKRNLSAKQRKALKAVKVTSAVSTISLAKPSNGGDVARVA